MAELFHQQYPHSIAVARRIRSAQDEFLDAVQSAHLSAFRNFNRSAPMHVSKRASHELR
jgi:hypothetical protein